MGNQLRGQRSRQSLEWSRTWNTRSGHLWQKLIPVLEKSWMSFPGVQRSRKNHDQDAIATPFCQEPTYRTSIYANMLNVYNLNTNGCQLGENYTKSRKWGIFWKPGSLQPSSTGPLCTLTPAVMRSCVGSFLPSDDFDFSSDRLDQVHLACRTQ